VKKSVYIMSSIEIIVGAFILVICSIIKDVFIHLDLGKRIYQSGIDAMVTSRISFPVATTIAVLLIIVGVVQLIVSIIKNKG